MSQANPPVRPGHTSREGVRRELRAGFRRALGLTILGTVVPGAGLTQTRSRKTGWTILVLALLSLGALAYVVLTTGLTDTALSVLSRPAVLQAIAVVFIVGGILWCGSIILTAVQSRPRKLDRARTRVLAAFTTLMVFLVAGGSFKVAEYASITQDTVTQVFGSAPIIPGQGAQVAEGEDPWAKQARVNILMLGSDAGKNREGVRTDSMIVASIDTRTGRTALISLPRNLLNAPLGPDSPLRARYSSGHFGQPNSTCAQGPGQCMLTNLWQEAEGYKTTNPTAYAGVPSPGRAEIQGAISEITGLKLDQTVIIDLRGFEQLIDAMGGLEVNVKLSANGTKLTIGGEHDASGRLFGVKGYFEPGLQRLDGFHSLWYARTRAADSNTYRQARQRCVVQDIVEQVNPASMVSKYPEIARILKSNIYTDIPAQHLPAFVELVERVQRSKITSVSLTANEGIYSSNPDYVQIRSRIAKALKPPTPKPAATASATATSTPPTPSPTTTPYEEC